VKRVERVAEGRVRGGASITKTRTPHPPFGHVLPSEEGRRAVELLGISPSSRPFLLAINALSKERPL